MALSAADYRLQIEQLVPPGPAWAEAKVRSGWAEEMARLDARVWALMEEADPRTARELLTDWERVLGLPDACMADVALTVADRQRLAWQRLTEIGGQSRAYFLQLAEQLGDIEPFATISEFRQFTCNSDCTESLVSAADEFVWRVNFNRPADNYRVMTCNDACTSALASFAPALAECPIRERAPAHTTVIFSYLTDPLFTLPDWRDWAYYLDLAIAAMPEA